MTFSGQQLFLMQSIKQSTIYCIHIWVVLITVIVHSEKKYMQSDNVGHVLFFTESGLERNVF